MISVTINGDKRSYEQVPLIRQVLDELKVPGNAVAVEVNRRIVPRSAHEEYRLKEGDEVEVVTFVGGG